MNYGFGRAVRAPTPTAVLPHVVDWDAGRPRDASEVPLDDDRGLEACETKLQAGQGSDSMLRKQSWAP